MRRTVEVLKNRRAPSGALALLLGVLPLFFGCESQMDPEFHPGIASDPCSGPQVLDVRQPFLKADYVSVSQKPLPAEYLSGVTLFGVSGAIISQGSWNMNAAAWPGAGVYTGFSSTLNASQVCAGSSIFGNPGTAVCQSGTTALAASASQILSGLEAWTATGTKITGTLANRGSLNALSFYPGSGFYDGTLTNAPSSSQIQLGSSILGVTGSYIGTFLSSAISFMHRTVGASQISLQTEVVTNAASAYTNATPYGVASGYRAIPNVALDLDTGGTALNRPGAWFSGCDAAGGTTGTGFTCKCGLSGTITQRIQDCASHGVLGALSTWYGSNIGNAAQSDWKLVTRTGNPSGSKGREVWQDQRTMLLWSSYVATVLNWCKASGSNNIAGNPTAQADPSGYCSNAANQATAGLAVSACFEDGGVNFTSTDAAIDPAGKGGLGYSSVPQVAWRLPTKYDQELADIDGILYVMPDIGVAQGEWSSTVSGSDPTRAFTFSYGVLKGLGLRNLSGYVRCVGR